MPNFFYIAKSFDGKTETGTINAANERQIADVLKNQGMVLIKTALKDGPEKFKLNLSLSFGRISLPNKIMIVRNMEVMFSAGLSLIKTFDILSGQAKNKKLKGILLDVRERINKGGSLSDALSKHPSAFSDFFVSMIKVGEESGTLEDVLKILSLHLIKEHELKSKIKNAMIYPALILVAMFAVGAVMVVFVLPNLSMFFSTLNVEVPIYTKVLLAAGNFLSKHWYILFLAPIIPVMIIWLALKTKNGKKIIDGFLLKFPVVSSVVKKNESAFLVRSMSSLIGAGVSLVRALEISSEIAQNYYFKRAAENASQKVKKGENLSSALSVNHHLFPYGVVEMIQVGEETGQTSDILKKLADFYEQEAIRSVEKIATMIEPTLIIALGLAAGFFALSVIQPIYSSLQTINQ